MLGKELHKVSRQLFSFVKYSSPELLETDIDVRTAKGIPRSVRFVGKCFLFSYLNPAGKKELPYYHLFPMVIMLEQKANTMLGLNPFYIQPELRTDLIERLLDNLIGNENDPDSRARVTYDILNKYRRRYRNAFPCIKQYQHNRMGKVVLEMKPELWREFYLGDVSKKHETLFRGASVRKIWSDSTNIARTEGSKKRK